MKFAELDLPGVWLIEPEPFTDERGMFRRHFCVDEFAAHGLAPTVVQGNVSENPHYGTLRGFHYQIGTDAEAKTFSCMAGSVYDIVLDLRPESPTFLRCVSVRFSADDRRSLHVPVGCANAWLTTSPTTLVHYYMSARYAPESARGLRYNDPAFDFRWPLEPKVISETDRSWADFDPESLERI